jgi:hypothetical protein
MNSMMKFNILLFAMAVPAFCVPALGADDNVPTCPVTGATGTTTTLPAMPPDHGQAPATGAGGAGSISIEAVQGTKGGPLIGEENVIVQLIPPDDENNPMPEIKTIKAKLDKQGKVDLKNLSLQTPFEPRVMVDHAGALFYVDGKPMDAENPSQKIAVTVYETTKETPKWELERRVLRIFPAPDGLEVTEMLAINNPSDRAWLGVPDTKGKPSWVLLSLPGGAYDLEQRIGLSVADGKLVCELPMYPGPTPVSIKYKLPVKDGQATLDLEATVPVKNMMLLLPNDKSTLQGQGVQFVREINMGQPVRAFSGPSMEAGQRLHLTVGNLVPASPVAASAASSSNLPQILAVVGGGVIVVLCVVMMVFRPGKKAKAADQPVKSKPAKG